MQQSSEPPLGDGLLIIPQTVKTRNNAKGPEHSSMDVPGLFFCVLLTQRKLHAKTKLHSKEHLHQLEVDLQHFQLCLRLNHRTQVQLIDHLIE
jgi:hypothetical protein